MLQFAVVENQDGGVVVTPVKWLNRSQSQMRYQKSTKNILKLVMGLKRSDSNWDVQNIKFHRSYG